MGAEGSRMGIAAMAVVSGIEKSHLDKLRKLFKKCSENSGEPSMISRSDFDGAVKEIELETPDVEILDRLFTLCDEPGDCKIDYKDFLVGVSLLISGSTSDKLLCAFNMFDEQESGTIMSGEMRRVLTSMNSVTSYFGDPVVTADQIKDLVIDVFKMSGSSTTPLRYADHLELISDHPTMKQFTSGKGTVRFGR